MLQGTISRTDRTGHGLLARYGEDDESRARAKAVFDAEIIKPGQAIADMTHGDGVFVKSFDPDHQTELLVINQMTSG